jgi:hypothetical protein
VVGFIHEYCGVGERAIGNAYHRLFAAGHDLIIRERKVVYEKCTGNDYDRRKYDAHEDTSVDNRLVLLPRRLAHHGVVNGINAK